jgi:hypothetical protein
MSTRLTASDTVVPLTDKKSRELRNLLTVGGMGGRIKKKMTIGNSMTGKEKMKILAMIYLASTKLVLWRKKQRQ